MDENYSIKDISPKSSPRLRKTLTHVYNKGTGYCYGWSYSMLVSVVYQSYFRLCNSTLNFDKISIVSNPVITQSRILHTIFNYGQPCCYLLHPVTITSILCLLLSHIIIYRDLSRSLGIIDWVPHPTQKRCLYRKQLRSCERKCGKCPVDLEVTISFICEDEMTHASNAI